MDPHSNLSSQDVWKSTILDEIFKALASSPDLSALLVYKGARVLRVRLNEALRASFDIDACLSGLAATVGNPTDPASLERIRDLIHRAIVSHFESQDPVRYELQSTQIANRRKIGPHPRGWDVYWLDIRLRNLSASGTPVNPEGPLRIDIAAPEIFSNRSVSPLELDGFSVNAVTLERIAGEKLRAFLSCLPTYRRKIGEKTQIDRRVKDLYDLARIIRRRPIDDVEFWTTSGAEFQLACQSRFIDCSGHSSFLDDWEATRMAFAAESTLPKDVTFDQAEATIESIVNFLSTQRLIPFAFALPDLVPG